MTLYLHEDGVVMSEHGCGLSNGGLSAPSSLLRQYGQLQKMLTWLKNYELHLY